MLKVLVIFLFSLLMSCSANLFNDLANKKADDALIFDAKTAVNQQNYQDAIDLITLQVSAAGQLKTEAREVLASAYAGKCGLNFIDYVNGLSNAASGSAFVLASSPFVGVAVTPQYCLLSLQTLDLIGPAASRTTDQNAFAAIVGMVLMGAGTRDATDNNPVNGDGIQDAPGVSCALTTTQVDQIILGYGYMATNFSALSISQIGASSSAAFTDVINTCGVACIITDPALITTPIRDTMVDLLNTSQYGVGTFDASNPLLIPVSCP